MEIDWTKYWDRYGDFFWMLGVWRKKAVYNYLLRDVDLKNTKILELGSGSGINSLTVAKILNGDRITLVDFNERAIEISKKLIEESDAQSDTSLHVKYLKKDVLKLKLDEKFDVVHSDGLVEHFYGKDRISVFKKHVDFCKTGGFIIIIAPYKSFQYTLLKASYKMLGRWIFDEEPLTKQELYRLCERLNLDILSEYTSPFLHKIGILAKKL